MSELKKYIQNNRANTLGFESQGDYYYGGLREGWLAALKWVKENTYIRSVDGGEELDKEINEVNNE